MVFTTSPTELTTGLTDAFLCTTGVLAAVYLARFRSLDRWKIGLWCSIMLLLATGSLIGTMTHIFTISAALNHILWLPIYLSIGLAVALFAVAANYDGWGKTASRRVLPILLVVALLFFVLTQLLSFGFLLFTLYEGLAMLFALGMYCWLRASKRAVSNGFVITGILATIVAAVVSSLPHFTIGAFNNSGFFHLTQALGVILISIGIRKAIMKNR